MHTLSKSRRGVCVACEIRPTFTTKIRQHMCFCSGPVWLYGPLHVLIFWVCAAQPCSAPQTPMQLQCCGPQTNSMRLSPWLVSCCHHCPMPRQLYWPIFPLLHKFLTVSCQRSCTYSSSSLYIPMLLSIHRPCHERQVMQVCHYISEVCVWVNAAGHDRLQSFISKCTFHHTFLAQ